MEVILLKDIKGLGSAGQVKNVSPGYARNYLVPRNLAVIATGTVRQEIAQHAAAEAKKAQADRSHAEERAASYQNIPLTFLARAGESGRLYGSITSGDIAERLTAAIGETIDKRKILLEEPIKELGTTEVDVRLHPGVIMKVIVTVEASAETE